MAFSAVQIPATPSVILTVNGGSSTIKFAAFSADAGENRLFSGQVERIGTPGARLIIAATSSSAKIESATLGSGTFDECIQHLLSYVKGKVGDDSVASIGHRLVHGGIHLLEHQLVTQELIAELRRNVPLDLSHLPREITLLERFMEAFPSVPQVACFDTAFHRYLPHVAQLLPIPRKYLDAGVRKFGFHGLSYTYLMSQLDVLAGSEAARGRIILVHLGSGASMAAVKEGKPIDTTMAFTPTSGLVMGTRPGDLDPGLLIYLMKMQKCSAEQMDQFISEQCGLLGVSATTSDMRDLLAARATDSRARDAIDLFCYQAKKQLCALAGSLGGLDTVVFAGGVGENAAEIRAGICGGLSFLGLELDPTLNSRGAQIVSSSQSTVCVRIIATDEDAVMVRLVRSIGHIGNAAEPESFKLY